MHVAKMPVDELLAQGLGEIEDFAHGICIKILGVLCRFLRSVFIL